MTPNPFDLGTQEVKGYKTSNASSTDISLSLCKSCHCMTKTIPYMEGLPLCGKCNYIKEEVVK